MDKRQQIRSMELRQEVEKLARKLATTEMGSPVGEGAQLQALWMLYQLSKTPPEVSEVPEEFAQSLRGMQETHEQSVQLIRELRGQVLDQAQMMHEMTQNALDLVNASMNGPSLDAMIPVLASAKKCEIEVPLIEEVNWTAVHACMERAPIHIVWGQDRPQGLDWISIDYRRSVTTFANDVSAFECIHEGTAALYRFSGIRTKKHKEIALAADLVWERRFLYTAQMTRDQQLKLEKKEN